MSLFYIPFDQLNFFKKMIDPKLLNGSHNINVHTY